MTMKIKPFIICIAMLAFSQQVNAQKLIAALDSLSRQYDQLNFHGVVLVGNRDSIIYSNAFGYSDIEKKTKLREGTLFKTESTGKMFTATGIMQLVERRKLRLDQTIATLLPGLPVKNADSITVHHLLTHTSGLQSPWDHPQYNFKKVYERKELEKIICELPLVFDKPGKKMYYSNSGYVILSWIIEAVSGISFDQYLEQEIFKPGKMTTVRHLNDTVMPPGEAQPYRYLNSRKFIRYNESVGPRANGAGGWIASASDLYRFMAGIERGRFLSRATLNNMITGNISKPSDSSYQYYGYGVETFVNKPLPGVVYFGHSGGGAGFSIDVICDTQSHYIVVFCSNTYVNSREISSNYLRAALGKAVLKPLQSPAIRLYDLVDSIGIVAFADDAGSYFEHLKITPSERLFMQVADAMSDARDFHSMAKWLEIAAGEYPESGFIHLAAGNTYAETGDKLLSKEHYQKARQIATKKGDQRMLDELDKKQAPEK